MVLKTALNLVFFTLSFIVFDAALHAQSDVEIQYLKQYNKNIRKPRINGVYIPKDLNDVYKELNELSSPNALQKFKLGEEQVVAKKLALGLGRWMFVNWNFYEGSRISHFLKTKYKITHPEDMSEFLIVCFHRYLNNKEIKEDDLAKSIVAKRVKMLVEKKIIVDPNLKK